MTLLITLPPTDPRPGSANESSDGTVWLSGYSPGHGIRRRLTIETLQKLLRFMVIRWRFRTIQGPTFSIERGWALDVHPSAIVRIGRSLVIGRDFTGVVRGELHIGNNVFFNRGCHVCAFTKVVIGDNCLFGEYVSIHDENHVAGRSEIPLSERGFLAKPIAIGDNVWVGAKASILSGVTIGDNAVVAAHAVVTRDVLPNCIVGGVPARVLREFQTPVEP